MAHIINPVEQEHCVFLTFESELAPLEVVSARYEINALLETKQWNRLVMDITSLTARQTALFVLDFAGGMFTGVPHDTKIAVIARPDQAKLTQMLGQTPRINVLTVAIFLDILSATNWVEESGPKNGKTGMLFPQNHA